jgi:isopenicillin N synthase-like dioxygenase
MLDVVDLTGLGAGNPASAAVRRVAAELGRACRDVGFFYIRNHGVPDAVISGIFDCSQAFFAAPAALKDDLAITRSRHNRGFVGVAIESLNLAQADLKEAFNIGLDLPAPDPESWPASRFAASTHGRQSSLMNLR